MVLPEAMGFGVVPIVFNSFAALDDILVDGEDGVKVTAFDEEAYSENLIAMISDDVRLKMMQSKALENSRKFCVSSILEKWDELFKNL